MTPESRRDQVLTQAVGNELVVYDERTDKAHRLNATAALVWRNADGSREVAELAASLRESLAPEEVGDPSLDVDDSEELVRLALEELDRSGLLVRALPVLGEPMTRRRMMAVAAALLPVVASILAPTPLMAQVAFWNGNYVNGTGSPGTGCEFGSSTIEVQVNMTSPGIGGSVVVIHRSGTQTLGTFTYSITSTSAAPSNQQAITVFGQGSGGSVTVNLTNQGGVRRASGNHTNLAQSCPVYNFANATRP